MSKSCKEDWPQASAHTLANITCTEKLIRSQEPIYGRVRVRDQFQAVLLGTLLNITSTLRSIVNFQFLQN